MRGTVYVIQNQKNKKIYVGQTKSGHPQERFNQHKRLSRTGKGSILHAAMRKYGEDSFLLIETIDTEWSNLNPLEKEIILKYNSIQPNGYNILAWGSISNLDEGWWKGKERAESTKQKMSKTKKEQYENMTEEDQEALKEQGRQAYLNLPEETKERIREEQCSWWSNMPEEEKKTFISGQAAKRVGHLVSETTRKKISLSNKGRMPSELAVQRSRETRLGSHHTDETKAKMSAAKLGKLKSEETKANMTLAQRNKRTPEQIERVLKIKEMLTQNMSLNSIAVIVDCTAEYVRKVRKGQRGRGI